MNHKNGVLFSMSERCNINFVCVCAIMTGSVLMMIFYTCNNIIICTKFHKLIFYITIFTRLMLLYRLRNFRHYSSLEELFCEPCLRKTNCFFASVILQHVCISQPNDSTIMLGHTQSHQHQCPLKQGHSDGM